MAGANPEEEKEEAEDWLVTYADAITLLMAFFVMLVSFSKIDIPMYEAVMAGISNEIGMGDNETPTEILQMSIQDAVYAMQANEVINVEVDDQGVVIELASGAFFFPGSAELRPEAVPVVERIFDMINAPDYLYYAVEISGHTDDDPISTPQFPSNWELAGGRSARIVRLFIEKEMHPKRLSALSFGDTRPKLRNRDKENNPIKENQAKNRRVELRVYPMSLDQRASIIKDIGVERMGMEGAEDVPMGNVMER